MTLNEVYFEKMSKANEIGFLSHFIFEFEGNTYYVKWRKNKWTEPKGIVKL